ncbi:MAG: FlhC family transcriptional regulator [Desulfobacca sp.]|nr:FlhC family transcriptional regulator [Desulfobacca sp.]
MEIATDTITRELTAWTTALNMMREGLTPPIVHAATGLCRNRLRDLYRQLHGRSAPQGRVSEYAYRRLQTRNQILEGIAFYGTYYGFGGDSIFRTLDHNLVMEAYREYKAFAPGGIDGTTAWYIARDLRGGVLTPKRCKICGGTYLYDPRSDLMSRCPVYAD